MKKAYADIREYLLAQFAVHFHGSFELGLLVFFDYRVHNVYLPALPDLLANELPDFLAFRIRYPTSGDRRPAGRKLIEYAQIQIAVKSES
jgi:hypothetical protein